MSGDLIKKLNDWGCDTDGALDRTCGDEACYLALIESYACPPELEALRSASLKGDWEAVMSAAFALKCTYGDLGFIPMYDPATDIVNALRAGRPGDVPMLVRRLTASEAEMRNILGK